MFASYLLGSLPVASLAARTHGVDLRKQGTFQVGAGNLWRTTSRKLGLSVGIFDFLKGMVMIWVGQAQGLDIAQQVVIGLAAIVGHNWPVFLGFHGGRGIATTVGIVIIIPVLNDITPWPAIIAIGIVFVGTIILRSSPLPVFVGAASLPVTNWAFDHEPGIVTAYLAIFLVIIVKRMTAQPAQETYSISMKRVLLNRLLLDRDISDKHAWLSRKPIKTQELLDETE